MAQHTVINEVKYVNSLLGENGGRKFPIHVTSLEELRVATENAPEAGEDTVEYTIQNGSSKPHACGLYRGVRGKALPYYFGNAFFAAFYGGINGRRIADYHDSLDIVAHNQVNENGMNSLGVLATGTKEYLTCFVYLLPPRSSTKVLEGGIRDASLLLDMHTYAVKLLEVGRFKQFFSEIAVRQYIAQTGYVFTAPLNDPYVVKTVVLETLEQNIPTNEIFPNQYAEKIA